MDSGQPRVVSGGTARNLYKGSQPPSEEDQAEFVKQVLLDDGLVPWRPYQHPTYGPIEIGGHKKEWGRLPPSFLLEEELHRNMAFTLYHASTMPLLRISDVNATPLGGTLFNVWVTVENQRLVPTRIAQDVRHRISPPDIVSVRGEKIRVVSSGRVTDRFFKRVEAVECRPERVELEAIPGLEAVRVQFLLRGSGPFTVTVDSAKGGRHHQDGSLP